jgi:hypothetical protein
MIEKWKVGTVEYWIQCFEDAVLVIFFNSSSNVTSFILLFIDLTQSMQSTMLKLVFPNSVRESKIPRDHISVYPFSHRIVPERSLPRLFPFLL